MIKRKRKIQQQLVTINELVGSDEYLFNHKFDSLDRELKKKIKEHEYESDARKRALILNAAERYERSGYPIRKICKRISDVLSKPEYNTSASYVRKILPEKYKDLDQMNIAKKQNVQDGATRYRQKRG